MSFRKTQMPKSYFQTRLHTCHPCHYWYLYACAFSVAVVTFCVPTEMGIWFFLSSFCRRLIHQMNKVKKTLNRSCSRMRLLLPHLRSCWIEWGREDAHHLGFPFISHFGEEVQFLLVLVLRVCHHLLWNLIQAILAAQILQVLLQ